MKPVSEILRELLDETNQPIQLQILRQWVEKIIEETTRYDWTEVSWEEQKEQLREIMWKL